jgi:hypothetical protein
VDISYEKVSLLLHFLYIFPLVWTRKLFSLEVQ